MKIDNIIKFLSELDLIIDRPEFEFLSSIALESKSYNQEIESSLLTNSQFNITGNIYLSNITKKINKAMINFSSFEIGKSIYEIESLIVNRSLEIPEDLLKLVRDYVADVISMIKEIEKFKFNNVSTVQSIYELGIKVSSKRSLLSGYKLSITNIKSLFTHNISPNENEGRVVLSFDSHLYYFQLHRKLSEMIDFVYSEICELLNISIQEFPLKISILHSGTENFDLLGNKQAILLFEKILTNTGEYFHENFTKAGEYKKLSVQFSDIVEKLKILTDLESNGFDMTQNKENLQKSLTLIVKAIEENLKYQYKLTINQKTIEIIPEEKRMLVSYEPRQISYQPIDLLA